MYNYRGDEKMYRELEESSLVSLAEAYMAYYNAEGDSWSYEQAFKRLNKEMNKEDSFFLGVYEENELAGFLMGDINEYPGIKVFFLEEILVFKEYQNLGYGTGLMTELDKRLKEKGVERINLMTTESEKHQNFYRKLGFLKHDFLINMKKEVDAK